MGSRSRRAITTVFVLFLAMVLSVLVMEMSSVTSGSAVILRTLRDSSTHTTTSESLEKDLISPQSKLSCPSP